MRIGIDGRRNLASGIGRVTSNLVDGLIGCDDQNEYIIFVSGHRDWRGDNVSVQFCDIPFFSRRDLFALPRLIAEAKLDLFISPQFYISPLIDCPTIKLVHDLWPLLYPEWVPTYDDFLSHFGHESAEGIFAFLEWFSDSYENGEILPDNSFLSRTLGRTDLMPTQRYVVAMMASTVSTAHRIVVPSMHTRNELAQVFPEVFHKVVVIPNFPSPVFRPDFKAMKRPFILHVAKWEPRKNVECVLRAGQVVFERLGVSLVLVGDPGYRSYGREILQMISSPPYNEFVRHTGIVSDQELAQLYRTAAVFVFPSLYEGFGIPPLEAMASGTPVVASRATALPEVCGDAAILVEPTDAEAIAAAIDRLLSNELLYSSLVDKGLSRAREFDQGQLIARLSQAAREVIEGGGKV